MRLFGLNSVSVTESSGTSTEKRLATTMAPRCEVATSLVKNNNEDDIEVAEDAIIQNLQELSSQISHQVTTNEQNGEESPDCETEVALSALDDYLKEFRRTPSEIEEMRQKIMDHLEDLGDDVHDYYNQCDIDWLLNPKKPHQIERFLISASVSEVDPFELICRCLLWRKEWRIMELKDTDFASEFYSKGGLFRYETDAAGTPLIYMRIKMVKKYPELDKHLKEFVAYQIHLLDSKANDDLCGWGIVFDCSDIGFANVQIDMLKFLITVLKDYFPAGGKCSFFYLSHLKDI
jgi:hypothetical protein